jgi:hypothetical protein
VLDDRVLNRKGEIPRNTVDVIYPDVLEPSEDVLDNFLWHFLMPP